MTNPALAIHVLQKERERVEEAMELTPFHPAVECQERYARLRDQERRLTKRIDELVEELLS